MSENDTLVFGDDECPKCGAGLEIFEDGVRCFECDWIVEFGNEFDFSAAENSRPGQDVKLRPGEMMYHITPAILSLRCHCEPRTLFPGRSNPHSRLEIASSQKTLLAMTY